MAEQPEMDSPTDTSVEKSVEQKIYKSEHDAVDDMKTLLGLHEESSEPEATRTHEVESEVSKPEEDDSTQNNEDLGEDAELINLLEEENPIESNEELIDLDGEKLTLEEIKKERLRQKDYTQKTQKLAEERKEIDSLKTNLSKEYDVAKQQRDYYQTLYPPRLFSFYYCQTSIHHKHHLHLIQGQTPSFLHLNSS